MLTTSDLAATQLADNDTALMLARRAVISTRVSVVVTRAADGDPIVWVNDGFTAITGYAREEVLGRSAQFLQGPGTDPADAARLSARDGTASITLLNYRKDGTPFWNRMVIDSLHDADGQITHRIAVQVDATVDVIDERARAAEEAVEANRADRLELIARVVDALGEHFDYHEAADTLSSTAIPLLADWGFVVLLDEAGQPEHFSFAVTDPAKEEVLHAVERLDRSWFGRLPHLQAALRAQPTDVLVPDPVDVASLTRTITSEDRLSWLSELGLGARLVVPLFARDQTLGMLVLESRDPDRFDVPTVVTATLLGRRVGVLLDNARLYRSERDAALTLQHRLLPPATTVADLDISVAYRPSGRRAEVGGDWYDVFGLDEHSTMLVVGDVVGHDMAAAAIMGQLSVLIRARSLSRRSDPLSLVLTDVAMTLDEMRWDDIASVVCVRCRATSSGFRMGYVNIGHPAPFVRLPDGTVEQLPTARFPPFGLLGHRDIDQDEIDLPPGSVVVLYTDGLVERRDRHLEDGLAALGEALRDAPAGSAEQVRDRLLGVLVEERPEDDVCLLVVRCPDDR